MKSKLFLDFDSVITDSVLAYCETYNEINRFTPDFIPADHTKNQEWDFKTQCPLVESPLYIFSHPLFFKNLKFMPNAEEVIKELTNKYQIIICSIGCFNNISLKSQWIKNNMPYIKDAILLTNQGIKMDKGIVQMGYKGSVFIDDVKSNLDSSNAERKILYGKKFDWNREWTGEYYETWSEIRGGLLK
jgi:5'(3')-deoxyribonucleotidase